MFLLQKKFYKYSKNNITLYYIKLTANRISKRKNYHSKRIHTLNKNGSIAVQRKATHIGRGGFKNISLKCKQEDLVILNERQVHTGSYEVELVDHIAGTVTTKERSAFSLNKKVNFPIWYPPPTILKMLDLRNLFFPR